MKEKIKTILEDALPLVDLDSQFLMAELDSLDVTTIMMDKFNIHIDATDATPANFKTLDTLAEMVKRKMADNA